MKGQFSVAKAGIGLILTLIMIVTIAAILGNIFPKKALDSSKAMDFALEHVYSQTPGSKTFGRVNVDCKKDKYISTADEVSNRFIDDPGKENLVGCKIDNFVLPQKVGWGEKYFPGKGDPEYILYFEDFPEEDSYSWSAMIGGDIILTIVPFGKIAKGFKIFGGAVKGIGKATFLGKVTFFLARGGKKLTAAGKKIPEFGRFSVKKSGKITEVGGRILSKIGHSELAGKTITVTKEGGKEINYKFVNEFFEAAGEEAPSKLTKTIGNIKYYSIKSLAYHLERNGIMRYTPRTSKAMVNELYNKGKIGKGLKDMAIDGIENKKKVLIQIPSWKDGSATKKAIDSLNKKGFDAEDMNKFMNKFIKDMGGTKSLIADDTIYMSSEGAKDLATNLGYTQGEKILALTPKFILINQGEKELDQLIGQGSGEEGDCTLFLQSSGGDRKKFEVESCRDNNKLDLETTKLVKSYGWSVGEIKFFDEYTKFYAASPCFSTMTDDTKDDVVTHDKNHNFILYPYKDEDEKVVRVNFPVRKDVPYYTERNANFCYEYPHSKIQLPIPGDNDITLWGLAPWPCHEMTILELLLRGGTLQLIADDYLDDYLNWGTCG